MTDALDEAEVILTEAGLVLMRGDDLDADALPAPVARGLKAALEYATITLGLIEMLRADELRMDVSPAHAPSEMYAVRGRIEEGSVTIQGRRYLVLTIATDRGPLDLVLDGPGLRELLAATKRLIVRARTTNREE